MRAAVAFCPLKTFSTFSIWRSERDMPGMVRGRRPEIDGTSHRAAIRARVRQDF
ncbi:MAG TPA: hypothetical protein VM580_22050 [Labilithrix sp.]|jgi:hypothetical protein|nr:hypothetical protein [Labilithrix sp.]